MPAQNTKGGNRNMTTERLYEFLVLSQSLNYSKAAPALHISQSVLTKHIKNMEKELGTTLFDRNTHGVALTPAGLLLSKEAEPLITSCNSSLKFLMPSDVPEKGTLRIGCTLELSYAAHIQVFIQNFSKTYPDIDVQTDILTTDWSAKALDSYDVLLTSFELRNVPANVYGKLIKSYGTYAVVYPDHKLLSKSHVQMRDLEGETIIVPYMQESFGPYARNWNLIKKQTCDRVNCLPVKDLPSALFQVSLCKGITIIPRYVKNMLPANSCIIWVSHQECRFNEYIYYKETMENGAAKLFYETFLKKN